MKILHIKGSKYFSFRSTVYSHGWADLLPFNLNTKDFSLDYIIPLNLTDQVSVRLNSDTDKDIIVKINQNLDKKSESALVEKINRMFRLDEDFEEFYTIVENDHDFQWILLKGAGRLIRCASLWEDMIKMLCTTNCTWRLTQIMVENLVKKFGFDGFPSAETIANKDENFLREEIKMGYRAPFLLEFAQSVANEKIVLANYENWNGDSQDLYNELRKIKGFGDYAVGNLMKLLGRYDFMGFDSWNRKQFTIKHNNGNSCSDEQITEFYAKYGKWAGLFFWMDITEEWYFKEPPW